MTEHSRAGLRARPGPGARTVGDRVGRDRADSVRVFAPADRSRRPVVRWAARHTASTGGALQILFDPAEDHAADVGPDGLVRLLGRTVVDLAGRVIGPLLPAVPGGLARQLAGAVAGARLLVVPQSLPQLPSLVEVLTEPLVAVPDAPLPDRRAGVLLAFAPWTGPEAVATAFETAARYGVGLGVVRAVTAGEDAAGELQACADDLAAWRIARPEVAVDVEVVDREPTEALLDRARHAQLVVTGSPARGRVRELVAPSPASELLRLAPCPVLVVPRPGPARPSWSARPGWGHGAGAIPAAAAGPWGP